MRIGVIGAGQLGQMLGIAADSLGHECLFLDPAEKPPARTVGPVVQAPFDDRVALAILAEKCDVVTYEFENVPVRALEDIADLATVYPPLDALRQAQDRLTEKQLFDRLDIPLPAYRSIDSAADLEAAGREIGLPLVVKTRRLGYDGKGQYLLRDVAQIDTALEELGRSGLIAEQWIAFDREVSAIGVRNPAGDIATYCLTQNEHGEGILRVSRAPVKDDQLTDKANGYMQRLLDNLDYVGVLALELFVVGGDLLANEFAPRVHNSGHWTIEGAQTSQFENHILAITGERPGPTTSINFAGMINLIGEIPAGCATLPACAVMHDYGKAARPGRKLGHITVTAETEGARDRLLDEIRQSVTDSSPPAGTLT